MVELTGLIVLTLNVILLLNVLNKFAQYKELRDEYRQIEQNMAEMVRENSRIVDIMLAGLEGRSVGNAPAAAPAPQAAEALENFCKEQQIREILQEKLPFTKTIKKKSAPAKQVHRAEPKAIYVHEDINSLFQQGLSVREIASRLGVSQGEVKLKLRISEALRSEASGR